MENNYKPNSHRYKKEQEQASERQKLPKVVRGTVKVKKKGFLDKLVGTFISEDATSVKDYVMDDLVIPYARRLLSDVFHDTIDIVFNGGAKRRSSNSNTYRADYVSYNKISDPRDRRYNESRSRSSYSYNEIILDTKGDAENILDQLDALIETYGKARVADLYDLVGITGSYTDNNYGWENISSAEAVRVRGGGYALKLPRAIPLPK